MACNSPFKLLWAVALTLLTSWTARSEVTAKGCLMCYPGVCGKGDRRGHVGNARLKCDMLGVTGEGMAGGPLTSDLQSLCLSTAGGQVRCAPVLVCLKLRLLPDCVHISLLASVSPILDPTSFLHRSTPDICRHPARHAVALPGWPT